jgi:hypothetical protein
MQGSSRQAAVYGLDCSVNVPPFPQIPSLFYDIHCDAADGPLPSHFSRVLERQPWENRNSILHFRVHENNTAISNLYRPKHIGVIYIYMNVCVCMSCAHACKKVSNPITGLDRPLGFQEVEAPRFLDNRHMKVVKLSALCTSRLYPPGNIPVTHFC